MGNPDSMGALARDLLAAFDRDGERALDEFGWASRFWSLGCEMDAGKSFEDAYGLVLGDVNGLEGSLARIYDVRVLGNAVFSECRCLTHWAMGPNPGGATGG